MVRLLGATAMLLMGAAAEECKECEASVALQRVNRKGVAPTSPTTQLLQAATKMLREGSTPAVLTFTKETFSEIEKEIFPKIIANHKFDQKMLDDQLVELNTIVKNYKKELLTLAANEKVEDKAAETHETCRGVDTVLDESASKAWAKAQGYVTSGCGTFDFSGSYNTKGLYAYPADHPKWANCAFFGTGGSVADMIEEPAAPKFRVPFSGEYNLCLDASKKNWKRAQKWKILLTAEKVYIKLAETLHGRFCPPDGTTWHSKNLHEDDINPMVPTLWEYRRVTKDIMIKFNVKGDYYFRTTIIEWMESDKVAMKANASHLVKRTECNSKKKILEQKSCARAQHHAQIIDTFETEFLAAETTFNKSKENIAVSEKDRIREFVTLKVVQCLLKKIEERNSTKCDEETDEADEIIKNCETTDVITIHLEIDYPCSPPRPCHDPVKCYPGTPICYRKEHFRSIEDFGFCFSDEKQDRVHNSFPMPAIHNKDCAIIDVSKYISNDCDNAPPYTGKTCKDFGIIPVDGEDCTGKSVHLWNGKPGEGFDHTKLADPAAKWTKQNYRQFGGAASCVAYVNTNGGNCGTFCEKHGLVCERGIDDAHAEVAGFRKWFKSLGKEETSCTALASDTRKGVQPNEGENGCQTSNWATQTCACKLPEAPKKVSLKNVCIGSRDETFASLKIPTGFVANRVDITHKTGLVGCSGSSGSSHFGCGTGNLLGLVIEPANVESLVGDEVPFMPNLDVAGLTKTGHGHAFWYNLPGTTGTSDLMEWHFKNPVTMDAGDYNLWYNEDLTGGTESDNAPGESCYDIELS